LILVFSCKKANNEIINKSLEQKFDAQTNLHIHTSRELYKSVDTTEFVFYWKQFRKAVLEHDTATLSLLINDSIKGGAFGIEPPSGISKAFFLEQLYNLFTPEYLLLLETYNIDKYLFLKGNNRRCWVTKKDVTFEAGLDFKYIQSKADNFYTIANYYMMRFKNYNHYENDVDNTDNDQFIGHKKKDSDDKYHIIYNFNFTHTPIGIKLYEVSVSYIVSVSD